MCEISSHFTTTPKERFWYMQTYTSFSSIPIYKTFNKTKRKKKIIKQSVTIAIKRFFFVVKGLRIQTYICNYKTIKICRNI